MLKLTFLKLVNFCAKLFWYNYTILKIYFYTRLEVSYNFHEKIFNIFISQFYIWFLSNYKTLGNILLYTMYDFKQFPVLIQSA